ncbi:bifunctional 3,4-dihydroxy-2-butanone-4-phosphate synthase/GTP cyclohydrolase II [Brackiella oedipodis]|uniref:bifunctional 3,4-dihydroxy-2-butanone-4-phosphate synthase/GTP cyclohydrolase II n=1 Tax=Brackiella oedipodis TaxID=124225 RepID=UPI00048B26BB|nr:bifunctional 3,4-dihydroxy-2-butanone-4-phosphate synthase/GTP cyclohydrolase II [Brackiella oedipodis]
MSHHQPPACESSEFGQIASVPEIIAELKAGRMVILVDEEDRENEGDLLMAADFVTPEAINFMVTHARGLVCLTLTQERCQQLGLDLMTTQNQSGFGTNFTVSIEAAKGVTTGISAADRAATVQAAVAPNAQPQDVVTPGHIFPVRAELGGVLVRAGHTEAGCDLTAMAGLTPAAVICEVLKPDGSMARLPDLLEFAKEHHLKIGTIADLIQYRSQTESMIERLGHKILSTAWGQFKAVTYQDKTSNAIHIALVKGDIQADQETLVRVHEPTSIIDVLDLDDDSHSWSIAKALQKIQAYEHGAVMLMMNCNQTTAALKQQVLSWDAQAQNQQDHFDVHSLRTYGVGAQILKDLGVSQMRVLSQPRKMPNMAGFNLTVTAYETH